MLVITAFRTNSASAVSRVIDDPAAAYKAKCAVCHSPKADKFFDPAKTDEQHVDVVLKGKKGEKPPYMPGFEAKGMTADEAKALVGYMRSIRVPSN
jgi:mono/diheme cytochrome c family protein